MPNDTRDPRAEPAAILLPWDSTPFEANEGPAAAVANWLAGSALLAVWTGLALLLTSA